MYTSGSLQGQTTNPAGALATVVKNLLATHSNWQFIEDYTQGSYTWSVWKCKAAGNLAGRDFYVAFPTVSPVQLNQFPIIAFEDYDSVAHKATHPVPMVNANSQQNWTVQSDQSRTGATSYSLAWADPFNSNIYLPVAGTVFDYWIVATASGLHVVTRIGTNSYAAAYAGLFETLVQNPTVNDPIPLWVGFTSASFGSSYPYNSVSRMPLVTPGLSVPWGFQLNSLGWSSVLDATQAGSATLIDLLQGSQPVAARVSLVHSASQNDNAQMYRYGYLRGLALDWVRLVTAAGVLIGDTITIGGHTYLYVGGASWIDTSAN